MNKSNQIKFIRKNILIKNLVIIDGLGRSGKFFLGKIVSGFKNMEYFQYASLFEQIPYLVKLGALTEDAGICLLQNHIDEYYYYRQLGRNINLRLDDATSITNSLEKEIYFKRTEMPYGDELKQAILNNTARNFLLVLHHTLPNISLYFSAYPDLKLINIIRNPIDLIYSWNKENLDERVSNESFNFWPNIMGSLGPIPWYANDWKDEFESISGLDRIIKSISHLIYLQDRSLASLSKIQKQQILTIKYEDVVENTHIVIDKIGSFLETTPLKNIDKVLQKENCPRPISLKEHNKKEKYILKKASSKYVQIMNEISKNYSIL
jgi:hypothetical protein